MDKPNVKQNTEIQNTGNQDSTLKDRINRVNGKMENGEWTGQNNYPCSLPTNITYTKLATSEYG